MSLVADGSADQGVRPGRVEHGRTRRARRRRPGPRDDDAAWKSGTRVSARRPWPGPWSRMIVPVSAIGDRAAGDDAAHPVEFGRGKRGLVAGQRDLAGQFGQPSGGEFRLVPRTGRGSGGPGGQHAGDGGGEASLRDALHDGAVVGGAFGEQGGDVVRGGVVVGAQVPRGPARRRRRVGVAVRALAGRWAAVGRRAAAGWRRGSWPGSGPSRRCSPAASPGPGPPGAERFRRRGRGVPGLGPAGQRRRQPPDPAGPGHQPAADRGGPLRGGQQPGRAKHPSGEREHRPFGGKILLSWRRPPWPAGAPAPREC